MNSRRAPRIADSRDRILATALRLFARQGIGNVSLRSVIAQAGVNPAAVHYHFGSRQALLREVFRIVRRPLNQERRELLSNTCGANGRPPDLRAVLHARFWPLFRRLTDTRDSEVATELAFISQLRLDPSTDARAVLAEHDREVERLFDAAMSRALPRLDRHALAVRLHLASSTAWDVVGQPDALDWIGAGDRRSLLRLYECFLDFIVAGFTQGVGFAGAFSSRSERSARRTRSSGTPARRVATPRNVTV